MIYARQRMILVFVSITAFFHGRKQSIAFIYKAEYHWLKNISISSVFRMGQAPNKIGPQSIEKIAFSFTLRSIEDMTKFRIDYS
jgi:hypothetical protein